MTYHGLWQSNQSPMHRRALHLAGFLLLLSTLGMAENSVARDDDYSLGARYISVLMAQQEAAAVIYTPYLSSVSKTAGTSLPVTSLAQLNAVWTMRPSAAQSISTHAVTGSSL